MCWLPPASGSGGEFEEAATIGHNFEAVIGDLETRMRAAAADLDFEEAARLRDEIKRLRSTELAVTDDPTAKFSHLLLPARGEKAGMRGPRRWAQNCGEAPSPRSLRSSTSPRAAGRGEKSKVHKPALDEMGIALHHEVAPHRPGGKRSGPRKPTLDEMGPGVELVPGKAQEAGSAGGATGTQKLGPRSTLGRPGMRGGWKPRGRH